MRPKSRKVIKKRQKIIAAGFGTAKMKKRAKQRQRKYGDGFGIASFTFRDPTRISLA